MDILQARAETDMAETAGDALTAEQRVDVREWCAGEFREEYDPNEERLWAFAYALARCICETDEPSAEQAAWYYDDAQENWAELPPGPWTIERLPASGNYTAVLIVNDRWLLGAEEGEGQIVLTAIAELGTVADRLAERDAAIAKVASHAYVINPEAIGDPDETPIVWHPVTGCPAHSEDWIYAAVRNNRRLSGLSPQNCTCDEKDK